MRARRRPLTVNRPAPKAVPPFGPDIVPESAPQGPFPEDELGSVSTLLKLGSDPSRLAILDYLSTGERSVTEIVDQRSTYSQPAISHHLALLKLAGLVKGRRSGKHILYSLAGCGGALIGLARQLAVEMRDRPVRPSGIAAR